MADPSHRPHQFWRFPLPDFSSFAGNPYLIDLDDLRADGLLLSAEYEKLNCGSRLDSVDYGILYRLRYDVFRHACQRLLKKVFQSTKPFASKTCFGWMNMPSLWRLRKGIMVCLGRAGRNHSSGGNPLLWIWPEKS